MSLPCQKLCGKRSTYFKTLCMQWLRENEPEVYHRLHKEAVKEYPLVRRGRKVGYCDVGINERSDEAIARI